MRSMYRYSVIALAVLALALATASTSFATTAVKGYAWAGIGILNDKPDSGTSTSDIKGESQGQMDWTGGVGNVTGHVRYRVRENSTTPAAVRHGVKWKVSDSLTLDWYGQSFGLPESFAGYGVYTTGVFGDGSTIGDLFASTTAFFVNSTGVDARFGVGAMTVGAALIDTCRPSCSASGDADKTIIPHFGGKFGAVTIGAYYALASGKSGSTTSKSSELSVSGNFKTSAMAIGFEFASDKGDSSSDDNKFTGIALGGDFGPIGFHVVNNKTKDPAGVVGSNITEISVAYTMPITEQASFIAGLANRKEAEGSSKGTKLQVLAAAKTTF